MYPDFAPPADFTSITHPGIVVFVGPDGSERVEPADRLPDWVKYAPGPAGAVPVVRVVRTQGDGGPSLRSYAADGRLVWVGLAVPAAPAAQPAQPTEFTIPRQRPEPRVRVTIEPTGWF